MPTVWDRLLAGLFLWQQLPALAWIFKDPNPIWAEVSKVQCTSAGEMMPLQHKRKALPWAELCVYHLVLQRPKCHWGKCAFLCNTSNFTPRITASTCLFLALHTNKGLLKVHLNSSRCFSVITGFKKWFTIMEKINYLTTKSHPFYNVRKQNGTFIIF